VKQRKDSEEFDLLAFGALFLDQEFRFIDSIEWGGKGIVELAFQEERRGKDLTLSPGGSAANTAIQARRLGMRVKLLGKVGKDPYATLLLDGLRAEAVDIDGVLFSTSQHTGTTVILSGRRADSLESAMITHNGANETLEASEIVELLEPLRGDLNGATVFFGDFFALPRLQHELADLFGYVKKLGGTLALDHGRFQRDATPAKVLKCLESSMGWVDIYLPSERELIEFTGRPDIEAALKAVFDDYPLQVLAVKMGPKGCRIRTRGEDIEVPAFPVREGVTSLGAGDAFNAAFLDQLRKDPRDLLRAARVANATGRIKIVSGRYPSRARVLAFLEKEEKRRRI